MSLVTDHEAETDHEAALGECAEQYRAATRQLEQARSALTAAVRSAIADGMRQADVVRAIGHLWTREHVRKVVNAERN